MAQQPTAMKILAIGSPLSQLSLTISKITAINAKHGPFDACVLVGDVFKVESDGSEINGIEFPVPTYFTLGKNELPANVQERVEQSGGEVVPNLVYLGKSTILTTAQGLKIGCIGGSYNEELYNSGEDTGNYSPTMTKPSLTQLLDNPLLTPQQTGNPSDLASARNTSQALPSAFQGLDLLLVHQPPPSLSLMPPSFASSGLALVEPAGPIEEVLKKGRPRYLFWSDGEGFWEREPFGWSSAAGREERWTRGVKLGSLGAEGDGKKARWFYAFTLPPQTVGTAIPAKPANATPNPYVVPSTSGKKRAALDDQGSVYTGGPGAKKGKTEHGPPPDGYTCKICSVPGHWIQDCPQKTEVDRSKPPPGYTCNICQSPDHFIKDCPNKETSDRARHAGGPRPPPEGYVCRACGIGGQHFIRECPLVVEREQERNKKKELGPAECWFCLSNPKVTKHLVAAIGSETYVTLPKGQLIPTTAAHIGEGPKPLVPGGGHVLIIPIAHHPTLLSIPASDAMPIITELETYKSALKSCYASFGAVPVTFEIGRLSGKGGHAHVQVVPIPKSLEGKVGESFKIAGERQGLDWEKEPERALARVGSGGNYFKVELPDGAKMVHLLKGNFDLQFGRMVLRSLMGLQHRIDWKECGQSEAEEKEDAMRFKKAFAPFMPAL